MSSALPLEITSGNLPSNYQGDFDDYFTAVQNRLKAVVPDNQVLTGYMGDTAPNVDIGPWFSVNYWKSWYSGTYKPSVYSAGYPYSVSLRANVSANRTQTVQDKSGVVALLYDVFVPRPTVILSGPNPNIDWSLGENFIYRMPGNATFTMTNGKDGKTILLALQNNATAYITAYPAFVIWPGGSVQQPDAGSAGKNATTLFLFFFQTIIRLGSPLNIIYGYKIGGSTSNPSTVVDTDPNDTAPPTYGQPPGTGEAPGPHEPPIHNLP